MQTEIQPISPDTEDTTYALAIRNQATFSARQSGLYRSTDNGAHWLNLYQAWMPEQDIPTLTVKLSPNFAEDQTVLAGVNGGIVLSTDGGETWIAHHFRNPTPMVTSIAISPAFANDQTILAGTYEDGMFKSVNGGRNWQAFNFGLFDHNILCVVMSPHFADDHTVFVGTSSGIYASHNDGQFWQDVTLPIGYDAILSLAFSPHFAEDGMILAGTESMGLLQSVDSGETWTTLYATDGAINAVLFSSDNSLVLHLDDTLITSDDFGKSWTTRIPEDVETITLGKDMSVVVALADGTIQQITL